MNLKKQFQTIVSIDSDLNETRQTIQVRPGDKILSKEPYAKNLYEAYTQGYQLTKDDASVISQMEGSISKTIMSGTLSKINSDGTRGEVFVSPKYSFIIDLLEDSVPRSEDGVFGKIDFSIVKHKNKVSIDAKSSKFLQEKRFNDLYAQINKPTQAFEGIITSTIKSGSGLVAGFKVTVNDVECFMPLSESDIILIDNAESRVGQTYYVIPINFMRNNIVVSHKEFLKYKERAVRNSFIDNRTDIVGYVNSIKEFGIFISIEGCISTLLPVNEMNDETRTKFEAGEIKVGDEIHFDIDSMNNDRIIITQQTSKREGWEQFERMIDYNMNELCKDFVRTQCKVSLIVSSGLIAQVVDIPDVKFFVSNRFINKAYKVNDPITIKIKDVDINKRTVKIFD